MKLSNQNPFVLFIFSVFLLTSCGEMKEEIVIDEDGSGFYEVSFDMIPMMRGMMQGMSQLTDEDMTEADSLEMIAAVEEQIWAQFPDEVDSTMDLQQGIPPEVRDSPEKMAVVEKASAFMRGGKSKGYLLTGVNYKFDDAEDLMKFYELSREGNKGDPKMDMLMGNTDTELVITANSFFRSQKVAQSDEEDQPDIEVIKKFFKDGGITTVITVPGKIKKLNVKTYEIVEQTKNSVTLKIDMLDLFTTEEPAEIDIKW